MSPRCWEKGSREPWSSHQRTFCAKQKQTSSVKETEKNLSPHIRCVRGSLSWGRKYRGKKGTRGREWGRQGGDAEGRLGHQRWRKGRNGSRRGVPLFSGVKGYLKVKTAALRWFPRDMWALSLKGEGEHTRRRQGWSAVTLLHPTWSRDAGTRRLARGPVGSTEQGYNKEMRLKLNLIRYAKKTENRLQI